VATVSLVAVTKGVPVARISAALAAGVELLGENRVQEAEAKVVALPGARWHLVGHLQSNKAARAMELFETIQAVDSIALARRIDRLVAGRQQGPFPIFVQVNIDRDAHKAGLSPDEVAQALREIAALDGLSLRGLMTVGRAVTEAEQARQTFAGLRQLSERLRAVEPRLGPELSMGMSGDFEVAIEEGATIVRIGRALFGERRPG